MAVLDPPFDLERLGAILREAGLDVSVPLTAVRMGTGQSNLTYLVRDDRARQLVVRRPPLGHLLASAHDVEREARIMQALETTTVPVPKVLMVAAPGVISDAPVAVMAHVDGVVIEGLDDAMALDPVARAAVGSQMASALAQIHRVDISTVGLDSLSSHRPYAARQLSRWSRQWEATRTRDLWWLDRLTRVLERHQPPTIGLCLVHGDFHLRNMILESSTGKVRAVLDWELATLGDPIADLGSMLAYWVQPGDPDTGLPDATSAPGFSTREDLVSTYVEASGNSPVHLGFWHALGLWKIAIIAEGVLRRAIEEPQNAAAGGPTRRSVESLIDLAWTVATDARLT